MGAFTLCAYAAVAGAWGILLLNLCFVITNLLGLYRVFLPYWRTRRVQPATPAGSLAPLALD